MNFGIAGRLRPVLGMAIFGTAALATCQTTLVANSFALKSNGVAKGTDYALQGNGYIGTFLSLSNSTNVTFKIRASGQIANKIWSVMGLHAGNRELNFTVGNTNFDTYSATISLPAGTIPVRLEFLNHYQDPKTNLSTNLTVRDITVSASANAGLKIVNPTNSASLKSTVFAVADSNIENFRKQTATVQFLDSTGKPLPKGTSIRVRLAKHAFNFGTAVPGIGVTWDAMWPNPTVPTLVTFHKAVVENFNLIEEENAGKWAYTEPTQGKPTMDYVDTILKFAKANGLKVRHHNLLWGAQQPDWAIALENSALSSDPKVAAAAKANLTKAITFRNGYVVRDRCLDYQELDGINEASPGHQPVFLNIFGYPGIATIYNNAINAERGAGSNGKVYFNDYDILDNGPDNYANWYLNFIQTVLDAGIPAANRNRLGVGIQYYVGSLAQHDPVRIFQSLQNLATLGFPISLTEFGVDNNQFDIAPKFSLKP
jgi:GH35 family endo-1,4-beta-xylanase